MKLRDRLKTLHTIMAAMIIMLVFSSLTLADPSHKRGNFRDKRDRKERKFINGHDARDGRWDGRGPRNMRRGGWDDCNRCDDNDRGWRRRRDDDDRDWRRRRWPRR